MMRISSSARPSKRVMCKLLVLSSFRGVPLVGGAELRPEQSPAEIGEPGDVAARVEAVLGGGTRRFPQQVESLPPVAGREGRLIGARDEDDVRAHGIADHSSEVRVVRTAEQQRIDT